jgi:putative RecB family exonuclease
MTLQPPPHLSPSSIGTFQQCPLKFKYNKIDKIVDGPTEATVMGNFVHDVLEDLYHQPAERRTLDTARALMRTQWDGKWHDEALGVVKDDRLNEFRWNAWWCVENYFGMEDPTALEPAGLETKVEGFIGDQKVLGFIDRWSQDADGHVTISDYKTGKVPRPQYQGDKFFQLLLYSILIEDMVEGATVTDVELLYVKGSKRLARKVTPEDVAATRETVVTVSKGVRERCKTGMFEASPSRLCDWCSYKTFCPAWAH